MESKKYKLNIENNKKLTDEEIMNTAQGISVLQREMKEKGVSERTPEKMAELVRKDLVFFIKNNKGEVVFSFYLDPFKNDQEEVYFLGGVASKDPGAVLGSSGKIEEFMNKHKDKPTLIRTGNPSVAKFFLKNFGFCKMEWTDFDKRFRENYQKYGEAEMKNFYISKENDNYIREKE